MSTVRVRPAEPADLPRLVEIASHSATAAHWNPQQYTRLFSPEAPRDQVTLVVQEDDRVAGFLAARQVAGSEWEIENVAVSGPARRRGLGSPLLGSFLDLVRSRGGIEVYLEVRESNRAAHIERSDRADPAAGNTAPRQLRRAGTHGSRGSGEGHCRRSFNERRGTAAA